MTQQRMTAAEQRDWHIHCPGKGCMEWVNITTRVGLFASAMKRQGWTYAGKGKWLCPECSA